MQERLHKCFCNLSLSETKHYFEYITVLSRKKLTLNSQYATRCDVKLGNQGQAAWIHSQAAKPEWDLRLYLRTTGSYCSNTDPWSYNRDFLFYFFLNKADEKVRKHRLCYDTSPSRIIPCSMRMLLTAEVTTLLLRNVLPAVRFLKTDRKWKALFSPTLLISRFPVFLGKAGQEDQSIHHATHCLWAITASTLFCTHKQQKWLKSTAVLVRSLSFKKPYYKTPLNYTNPLDHSFNFH